MAYPEFYTLSLHDALPILPLSHRPGGIAKCHQAQRRPAGRGRAERHCGRDLLADHRSWAWVRTRARSEEHTSELQSRQYLVCRLLLEKKKMQKISSTQCHA